MTFLVEWRHIDRPGVLATARQQQAIFISTGRTPPIRTRRSPRLDPEGDVAMPPTASGGGCGRPARLADVGTDIDVIDTDADVIDADTDTDTEHPGTYRPLLYVRCGPRGDKNDHASFGRLGHRLGQKSNERSTVSRIRSTSGR
jgi:hypothetical protein